MANEDQPHNDHSLHIEPCLCGNPAPEVSGDDFDASVDCAVCHRSTVGSGTRGSINIWNRQTAEHKSGIKEFPAYMPWGLSKILAGADELEKEVKEQQDLPHTAESVKIALECVTTIRDTVNQTWQKILEREIPFHPTETPPQNLPT